MPVQKTSAILLRRVDYGDADLILTLFSETHGKIGVIAKHAKRSRKRFAGVLELFSNLSIQCRTRRQGGLAVLEEAQIIEPYAALREHILKTAYASYWAELVMVWTEDKQPLAPLYHLLCYTLGELNAGRQIDAQLNLAFQMRFMALAGLCPNLNYCCVCRTALENFKVTAAGFDLPRGGVCCLDCDQPHDTALCLSRGTIKQLQWIAEGDLSRVGRIRFSTAALNEAQHFLEAFVPYHLGREPRSLKFLRQIRPCATAA
ncbi:MAG: DNA repair protein RecO [Desulfobacterales bacterium]|nr:DNA repair protein RecO [Desulfobacterales bacterium]